MFANSLADGGVYNGLLRYQARRYALEGILGNRAAVFTVAKSILRI